MNKIVTDHAYNRGQKEEDKKAQIEKYFFIILSKAQWVRGNIKKCTTIKYKVKTIICHISSKTSNQSRSSRTDSI